MVVNVTSQNVRIFRHSKSLGADFSNAQFCLRLLTDPKAITLQRSVQQESTRLFMSRVSNVSLLVKQLLIRGRLVEAMTTWSTYMAEQGLEEGSHENLLRQEHGHLDAEIFLRTAILQASSREDIMDRCRLLYCLDSFLRRWGVSDYSAITMSLHQYPGRRTLRKCASCSDLDEKKMKGTLQHGYTSSPCFKHSLERARMTNDVNKRKILTKAKVF